MQAKRSRLLGKAQRTPSTGEPSPLLPQWAFVVQFRTETDVKRSRCTGRVEHVVSGQATHFDSLEELLTFMTRVLTEVRAPPRRRPRKGG